MDVLIDYAPQMLAVLTGGLVSSLGPVVLARSARGRARLPGVSGWALAAYAAVCAGAGVAAFLWAYGSMVEILTLDPESAPAASLLLFGLGIGLPLSVPGLVVAWHEARTSGRRRPRDHVPTKDDRRDFAAGLARQIEEASDRPRDLAVSIGGDGGRVLILEGDLGAEEGERLTAALRAELMELGFKRVEGAGGRNPWWAKV